MSRISYSDEEDYPGQFALWRANLNRSLEGRRGQQALRDLETALLALPEKRLIGYHLVKDDSVCANGALVAHRRMAQGATREEVLARMREEVAPACSNCWHDKAEHSPLTCTGCAERVRRYLAEGPVFRGARAPAGCPGYEPGDPGLDEDGGGASTEDIAASEGVPRMVAWAIVEQNDDLDRASSISQWDAETKSWQYPTETDEQRYERILRWAQRRIKREEVHA